MDPTNRILSVYSSDGQHSDCFRCHRTLEHVDIAMLLRTSKDDAYAAWCADCTRWVLSLAADALDVEPEAAIVAIF